METGIRVVAENEDFLTLAPYAPRFPFETWILPKRHESAFENSSSHMFENLAKALKTLLMKADRVLDNPPYNLVIHSSPVQDPTNDHYHWHIEFMPKLTKTAGFEWGTGFLHQSHAAGRSGQVPARSQDRRTQPWQLHSVKPVILNARAVREAGGYAVEGPLRALTKLWGFKAFSIEMPGWTFISVKSIGSFDSITASRTRSSYYAQDDKET